MTDARLLLPNASMMKSMIAADPVFSIIQCYVTSQRSHVASVPMN